MKQLTRNQHTGNEFKAVINDERLEKYLKSQLSCKRRSQPFTVNASANATDRYLQERMRGQLYGGLDVYHSRKLDKPSPFKNEAVEYNGFASKSTGKGSYIAAINVPEVAAECDNIGYSLGAPASTVTSLAAKKRRQRNEGSKYPALNLKSSKLIDEHRERWAASLWNKLNLSSGEGVVLDMFLLDHHSESLSTLEKDFLKACIPSFLQVSIFRNDNDMEANEGALGLPEQPNVPLLNAKQVKATDNGPTEARDARDAGDAEAESSISKFEGQDSFTDENQNLERYKLLANEHQRVVAVNVKNRGTNSFRKGPMLLVPEKQFIRVVKDTLKSTFGKDSIDRYRRELMQKLHHCKSVSAATGTSEYESSKEKRKDTSQMAKQRASKEIIAALLAKSSLHHPDCIDSCNHTHAWGPIKAFGGAKFRFGERHHFEMSIREATEKRRLRLLLGKQQHSNARESELKECTFFPKINKTPAYLRLSRPPGMDDPIVFMRTYARKFTEDTKCKEVVEELARCSFQPNVQRIVELEKQKQLRLIESSEKSANRRYGGGSTQAKDEQSLKNEAFVEKAYEIIDHPFDRVYQLHIQKWIKEFAVFYPESKVHTKRDNALDKPWEAEKREPQYSGPYSSRHHHCRVIPAQAEQPSVNKLGNTKQKLVNYGGRNHFNRWTDSLRGGYKPIHFNSGVKDCTLPASRITKQTRYQMRDWGKHIRLNNRCKEPRIIPNYELIDAVCLEKSAIDCTPPPTIWNHKRRINSNLEAKSCSVDTEALACHGVEVTPGQSNGIPTWQNRNTKQATTTFTVPTPLKSHQILRNMRIAEELRYTHENGGLHVPPKVVATKKDLLSDIEALLEEEPPILLMNGLDIPSQNATNDRLRQIGDLVCNSGDKSKG